MLVLPGRALGRGLRLAAAAEGELRAVDELVLTARRLQWGLLLLGAGLGFVAARRLGRRKLKRLTRDLGRGLWDLRGASPETLKALVGELPTWFKHGEWEQGKFLNHYLTTQWPFLDKAISDIVLNAASPALAAARPLILKTLEFDNFSLGTIAPRIVGIRHIESLEDATTLEVHLKWKGNPKIVLNVQSRAGISVGKTRAGIGMRIAVTVSAGAGGPSAAED